jgi:hypothetical protein
MIEIRESIKINVIEYVTHNIYQIVSSNDTAKISLFYPEITKGW